MSYSAYINGERMSAKYSRIAAFFPVAVETPGSVADHAHLFLRYRQKD